MAVRLFLGVVLFGAVLFRAASPPAASAQTVAPAPAAPPVPAQPTVPAEIQPGGPTRPPDVQGPAADPLARDAVPADRVAPTLPSPDSPGSTRGAVPK